MSTLARPRVLRIHHLKLAVTRLDVSLVWYERVLGARRIPELDHTRPDGTRYAVICQMAEWSGLVLELRENETQAAKDRGWDPITILVQSRDDILDWINWLNRWGSAHSPLLVGPRGWVLVFEVRSQAQARLC